MSADNNVLPGDPRVVSVQVAQLVGLLPALFLQQVHYWCSKKKHPRDGHYWVYNTLDEWHAQLPFASKPTLERAIKKLRQQNFLVVGRYNKVRFDRTLWYRVDYERLKSAGIAVPYWMAG